MFRECFMLHRATRSVFAIDGFVNLQAANIPNPILRAAFTAAGLYGRVSKRFFFYLVVVVNFSSVLVFCYQVSVGQYDDRPSL